jgi:hypothetical protein
MGGGRHLRWVHRRGIGITAARERVPERRVRSVADWWRRHRANGDVIIVRFADDYTIGFQYAQDARRFLAVLGHRLARFGLELPTDKTRLIEFGRRAAADRSRRGLGKPETFIPGGSRTSARGPGRGASGLGASRSRNGCGRSWQRSRTSSSVAGMTPSRSRNGGWPQCCTGTWPTTRYRETLLRYRPSDTR